MGIVNCESCAKSINLDIEDNYSCSDDNTYLCEECSKKPNTHHRKATREEIKQHHQEEFDMGIL